MQDAYEKIQNKMRQLHMLGYDVVEMWECEWTLLKQTSPDIEAYANSLQFVEPLNPRDAFSGGHTNAVKFYHHVPPGQKMHYINYTSLYPWVNKACVYPKGHPRLISHPGHTDIDIYFGVIKCRVLPHVNCTIPYCLNAMLANSPFLSVLPACKEKCKTSLAEISPVRTLR